MYGMELSEKVRHYQNAGENGDEIMERISLFIYRWALGKKNLGEDGAADFLLSFLPRVKSLIRNYNNYDCPFEHYVKVCLEWHMVKFHTNRLKTMKKEELYWQTTGKQELLQACQKASVYGRGGERTSGPDLPEAMKNRRFKRRFLEYLLYYVDEIKYEMIDAYADYLGMEKDRLLRFLKEAEEMIRKKKEKREAILEKKRTYYIDHRYQEMKLRTAEDCNARQEILDRMDLLKYRMDQLTARVDRIKMTPTAEQVGSLTGSSSSTACRNIKMVREFLASFPAGSE